MNIIRNKSVLLTVMFFLSFITVCGQEVIKTKNNLNQYFLVNGNYSNPIHEKADYKTVKFRFKLTYFPSFSLGNKKILEVAPTVSIGKNLERFKSGVNSGQRERNISLFYGATFLKTLNSKGKVPWLIGVQGMLFDEFIRSENNGRNENIQQKGFGFSLLLGMELDKRKIKLVPFMSLERKERTLLHEFNTRKELNLDYGIALKF